jgi:hypothetical protein
MAQEKPLDLAVVQAWLAAWNESDVFSDASARHLQSLITDPGFVAGKPAPQLASSGSPAHQPINPAAPIAAAAKPAASLARCLFRLLA